jgi:vitamin B12 transporter
VPAVLAATVLGLPTLLRADDAPGPPPPPEVHRSVPEVVAEAVEPAEPPQDPSSFTTVIEVEDYRGEVTSTEELLSRVPGVHVRRFGGPGDPAEISIRGSTSQQVVIQLDGIRLDTAQSGSVDLSTIPLALLDRIEVSRGGGSVESGSGAIGGVVNLVTLRPGGPPRNTLVGTAGSFGTWEVSGARSGTARDTEYVLGYDWFQTEGDWTFERFDQQTGIGVVKPVPAEATRINNASESQAGLIGLGRGFGDDVHLSFRDAFYYDSRGMPGLDAGSVGEAGQRAEAHERRLRNLAGLQLEAADVAGRGVDLTVDGGYLWEGVRFQDSEEVPRLGTSVDSDDSNATATLRARADAARRIAWSDHRATLSVEGQRDTLASDVFDAQSRNALALAVQDDVGFFTRRLRILPALRWQDTEGFGGAWLPRIGLIAEPWAGLRLKGNLERAYRVPSFDELYFPDKGFIRGNPGLSSEDAVEGDLGVEVALARLGPLRDVSLQAVGFYDDITDSIVYVLVSPSLVEPENTGPATVTGAELSGSFRVFEWVGLEASYTYLDARRDGLGTPLPGRPDQELDLRLDLGPPSRAARLVVEMQAVGEIPVTDTGNTRLPSRTVWDAALSFDLARWPALRDRVGGFRHLVLTFQGTNLTNAVVRDAEFFPQPGRGFAVRVEGDF